MGHEEGKDGVEHRLQAEDDPHMGGGGVLEGHRLDQEGGPGAEQGEHQNGGPDGGGPGEVRSLQKDAEDQHPQAGDQLLIDPQLEGVHLRTGHCPLCDDEVDGVGQGAQDAQDVPQGGAQVVGQGEQGDASHRHDQHQSQLPGGPAAEEQEVQQGGKDHRQGTQKAGVGQAGVFDPEGGGGVYAKQGRSGGKGGLEGGGAGMAQPWKKAQAPHHKGQQEPNGVKAEHPHLRQRQIGEEIGDAPEEGDQDQHQVRFQLCVHSAPSLCLMRAL